jgi:hypothetical protein
MITEQLKNGKMKTNSTQREILLVTNNSFAKRQWCRKELRSDNNNNTPQEQMEEICANGLIYDILPELFETEKNKKLYLWQIHPDFSFLQLEYGEFPLEIEKAKSIDPHNSLSFMCYN